jgi:hypothetical protein
MTGTQAESLTKKVKVNVQGQKQIKIMEVNATCIE